MGGFDGGEVPPVRGQNGIDPQPFGNVNQGRVDKPDVRVRVLFQDRDSPGHIGTGHLLDGHLPIVQGDEGGLPHFFHSKRSCSSATLRRPLSPIPTNENLRTVFLFRLTRRATILGLSVSSTCWQAGEDRQRLPRYQRAMSRKQKFSNNWKKAKAKVQKVHALIANARRDYLHKATTTISKNHAIVCIEDLQVRNLSKSAAGSSEKPGKNVRAKSGLNRSILDQGWFEFRRQLEYKQAWRGGSVIAVPPRNTSRTCPACRHVSADNRQTQVRFACVGCGFEENADLVGAINILAAGHAAIACGESVQSGRSAKQEPTEATQAVSA
jgi:IS605 OrfB family transposase